MIKYLFLLILPIALWSGETVVLLRDGSRHLVKTTFGKPDHQSNEFFSIASIQPSFDKFEGWRNIHFFWAVTLGMNKEFKGIIKINSLLDPDRSWSMPLNSGPVRNFVAIHRFEIMESESTPVMWEWVNEPGESWIPFHFIVKTEIPGNPVDFIEWVKISEKDKKIMRLDLIKIKNFYSNYNMTEIISITNEKYKIKTINNEPLRFENNFLQINSLLPGVINNNSSEVVRSLAFSISGKYRGNSEVLFTITIPWLNSNSPHKVKIKNSGNFQIPFAFSHITPEFWRWLESQDEFWFPIQVQVENKDTGQSYDFTEWFHVTNDIRMNLAKLRKSSLSS